MELSMKKNPRQADPENPDRDAHGRTPIGDMSDGIPENDDPMPGWWIWLFVTCMVWTLFYLVGVHQFEIINSNEDPLALKQADRVEAVKAREESAQSATVNNDFLSAFLGIAEQEAAGKLTYSANCASCHGDDGEGFIGPNLTDDFWIYGNTPAEIFSVITEGVLDKGMTPWGPILSINERAQLVAYLHTLLGTNPEGAMPPEGELVLAEDT